MIATKWIEKKIKYDGTQLRSLYAYLEHGVLGDSIIAFRGPCDISFKHMVDGEDLLQEAEIRGSDMIHFIFEIFDRPLLTGVLLQRLFASIVADQIEVLSKNKVRLRRCGDDLYLEKKKLSISIAAKTTQSLMIHFAVNVSTKGTPVPTIGLSDLGVDPKKFVKNILVDIAAEYQDMVQASCKVRPLV